MHFVKFWMRFWHLVSVTSFQTSILIFALEPRPTDWERICFVWNYWRHEGTEQYDFLSFRVALEKFLRLITKAFQWNGKWRIRKWPPGVRIR
jgi:hypothetical protein